MEGTGTLDLAVPGAGLWQVQNSPADRVPSHGTDAFASSHAIDLTPVDDRGVSGAVSFATLLRPEAPERFVGFGRPLTSPLEGTVVSVDDAHADHPAYRGIPSAWYMLTQGRRAAHGWRAVAGNHVVIAAVRAQVFVALCHVRHRSIRVAPGDRVHTGQVLAACGNSGNSTEPHVHLQAMTAADPHAARAVPFTVDGALPRTGSIIGALW